MFFQDPAEESGSLPVPKNGSDAIGLNSTKSIGEGSMDAKELFSLNVDIPKSNISLNISQADVNDTVILQPHFNGSVGSSDHYQGFVKAIYGLSDYLKSLVEAGFEAENQFVKDLQLFLNASANGSPQATAPLDFAFGETSGALVGEPSIKEKLKDCDLDYNSICRACPKENVAIGFGIKAWFEPFAEPVTLIVLTLSLLLTLVALFLGILFLVSKIIGFCKAKCCLRPNPRINEESEYIFT